MRRKNLIYVCTLAAALAVGVYAMQRPSNGAPKGAGDEVLAVVNGRPITRGEVDERAGAQVSGLESKLYQLRKGALNAAINDLLLEAEAGRRGVSVGELRQSLTPAGAEVTEAEVERAYAAQAGRLGNVDEATARQQIRETLERRARLGNYEKLLGELRRQGGVEIRLRPPAEVKVNVGSDGPSKGSPDAPVVIVEFSDYECPACQKAEAPVRRLVEEYGDKVRLVYRHLPLPMHKSAFGAAQAAVCAGEQGKFWEMHGLLFARADGLAADALRGYAARLGLDAAAFGRCLESESSRAAVTRDLEEARAAGIRSTPTFVINGKLMPGARSAEEFKAIVDRELQARDSGR